MYSISLSTMSISIWIPPLPINFPRHLSLLLAIKPMKEDYLGTETHVWEEQQTVETVETHFVSDLIHHQIQGDTDFEDAHEEDTDEFQSLDEVYSRLKGGGVDRTKSDGDFPPKPPPKVKRSASLKVGFSHLEEEEVVEARRPTTTRERKDAVEEDDVEVDAKADDFINKFKNDLILQRIESIARTKAVSSRGTAK